MNENEKNWPFASGHSRGTKPPYWRAKVALGQDKQRKLPFKIMYAFCLSCPSATFAHQHGGGFVSREWPAAKGLLRFLKITLDSRLLVQIGVNKLCSFSNFISVQKV